MKALFILIFSLKVTFLLGQHVRKEIAITDLRKSLPEGYTILDTATGDLNKDDLDDLIVLYRKINEEETSDVVDNPEKRPLAIYLGVGLDTFRLAALNENVAYCYDCGGMMGDPYQAIVIKNGYFTVEHYGGSGWRWTRYVTFKYSPKEGMWYLYKDGGDSFHAGEPEKVTTNVMTVSDFGVVPFEEYTIYKDFD